MAWSGKKSQQGLSIIRAIAIRKLTQEDWPMRWGDLAKRFWGFLPWTREGRGCRWPGNGYIKKKSGKRTVWRSLQVSRGGGYSKEHETGPWNRKSSLYWLPWWRAPKATLKKKKKRQSVCLSPSSPSPHAPNSWLRSIRRVEEGVEKFINRKDNQDQDHASPFTGKSTSVLHARAEQEGKDGKSDWSLIFDL